MHVMRRNKEKNENNVIKSKLFRLYARRMDDLARLPIRHNFELRVNHPK